MDSMYTTDKRIVMTLDAGGTNLVFSAMQGGVEVVEPVTLPAASHNLNDCLRNITEGFETIRKALPEPPAAISFAFPGPADYEAGIIGDLPNFPSFRGGVALGPYLKEVFGIPVFINNDGNLFAYGEALAGALPQLNKRLAGAGSIRRYRNLLGITLGTGFGAGVVLDGRLLLGDNGTGGDVWCLRNKKYPHCIAEESVSIRAVKRVYQALAGEWNEESAHLTPKELFEIAEGVRPGNREAAIRSFAQLGEMAGDAIAQAITLIDGVVVIGGGLAGASRYILPSLIAELNSSLQMMDGTTVNRLQMKAFNLEEEDQFAVFAKGEAVKIRVPGTDRQIDYDPFKRFGVMISKQGTSRSVALGAYVYALDQL